MTRSLAVKLMFDKHPIAFKDEARKAYYEDDYGPISDNLLIHSINFRGEASIRDEDNWTFIDNVPLKHIIAKL